MKVLLIGDFDTGGQGVRIVKAFQDDPDWEVRSMAKTASYMAYGTDLPYRRRVMEEMYPECDVIHVRNHFADYDRLAKMFGPKPVVLHVHGTRYRSDPNRTIQQARERNAIVVCSTLDLWLLNPSESVWLPAPYDVDWLASL